MTARPKLLDLFCGAGGCSVGYHRAGFDVTGVDIEEMPQYPYMDVLREDALAILGDAEFVSQFDAIHASPPCQTYSVTRNRWAGRKHPDLVGKVRDELERIGLPWVIENVVGAPLRDPLLLCGSMFDLGCGEAVLRRHRLFEASFPLAGLRSCSCHARPTVGVYGTGGAWTRTAPGGGGGTKVSGHEAAVALGIDWTDRQEVLAQAIPPAYTEYIGRQIIGQLVAA